MAPLVRYEEDVAFTESVEQDVSGCKNYPHASQDADVMGRTVSITELRCKMSCSCSDRTAALDRKEQRHGLRYVVGCSVR